MSKLTEDLAQFVAGLTYEALPEDVVAAARIGFIDTVAVMLAGAEDPVVGVLTAAVGADRRNDAKARVAFSDTRLAAREAALIGGAAAHALDYDDVALSGHPSAVLVPTILALGEALESTGRDLVTSYVAGYEVWAELVRRDKDHHRKGWHPTAIFGPIAAAAAAAVLRKLDARQTRNALALAASHAGGLVANFGTMAKPYHVGKAAQDGIYVTDLAARGFEAAADALEHPQGFLKAVSPGAEPDLASPVVTGKQWHLRKHGLCIKKYPTCYATHRSLDGMLALRAKHGFTADQIESIDVTMGHTQSAPLRYARPQSGLQAKFSEPFAMAAAVVLGRVGMADLTDEVVAREDIRGLLDKVHLHTVPEQDPEDPVFSPTEQVVVRLKSGDVLHSGDIRYARGHAKLPLSDDDLWTKFSQCVARRARPEEAKALFAKLGRIDQLAGVGDLPTLGR